MSNLQMLGTTRSVTHTQLARVTPFIHRCKPQTLSFAQCSYKTAVDYVRGFPKSSQKSKLSNSPRPLPASLSEELSKNMVVLSCKSTAKGGVCKVFLVGTYHVSKLEDLLTVPSPKSSAKRIFKSVGVAAAGIAILSGVYLSCKN